MNSRTVAISPSLARRKVNVMSTRSMRPHHRRPCLFSHQQPERHIERTYAHPTRKPAPHLDTYAITRTHHATSGRGDSGGWAHSCPEGPWPQRSTKPNWDSWIVIRRVHLLIC